MEIYSKKISDIYWYPINFDLIGNKINIKKTYFVFNNGFKTNIYNFLNDPNDFKLNKKTGIILTDLQTNNNFFEDKGVPEIISSLSKIETPFKTSDSFVITLSTYQNTNILYKSYNTNYSNLDNLKLIFDSNSVSIENYDRNLLTYDNSNNLFFSSRISPLPNTQKFNYLLGDDNIVLFSYGSNYTKAVTINNNRTLTLTNVSYELNSNIESNKILYFISYKKNNSINSNIKNSYFCRYESSPLISQEEIIPSNESLNENYIQNYLAFFPYQNPNFDEKTETVSYDLQIHGLKNYQTSEYNYSRGIEYYQGYPSIRRRYSNIFSGTNQENGSDKLHLGFKTNTYLKTFEPDKYTVFYFPPTTDRLSVNASGLIEDGAYYGELPYVSDRIYSRQISYEELTPGVPQPASMTRLDGTWVCTWLSGNDSGEKKWMDRFFNSAYYTADTVLGSTDLLYNEKLNPNVDFEVWDEVSTMHFEPGGQYVYYRSGKETSKSFLNYLNSNLYNTLGSKILDVSNFTKTELTDNTPYSNNGFIVENSESNLNENYLKLTGKNHIVFPAKNVLLEKNNLTLSFWLRVDDWENINGDQIIGNYYDSGFGLINEASLTSPIFTLIDSTSGNVFNLNFKLSHIDNIAIPQEPNSQNNIVQRMLDYSYWIVDSYNRKLRKYNVDGKLQKTVDISTDPLTNLSYINQLEIDSQENLYLYSINDKKIIILDQQGNYIKSVTYANVHDYRRIEIQKEEQQSLENNILYSYGNASTVDNDNNLWEVIGGNLYKNREIFANLGAIQQLSCDSKNNLWIVYQKDKITKFNISENKFEFTKSIGKNSLIDEDCFEYNVQFRFLNFIKTPKTNKTCIETSEKTEDLAVLVDNSDKLVYLINSEGLLVSKLSLYGLLTVDLSTILGSRDFKALGDFTGYQFLRKFNTSSEKYLGWKFKIANANGGNGKLLNLTYDVKNLPPGWHNFVFNFDSTNGYAKYYIDTILVKTEYFEKAKYQLQYDYKSSILVGASTIKNRTLNDIIQVDDAYKLIGDVGHILMYNKSLTYGEISQIYFTSDFSIDKGPLKWNIPIGERNYVEEIKHWFQMQLPTSKSKYFNINIHNLQADDDVKKIIEESIKSNIKKIIPAHTDLYKINWIDEQKNK
jgi:hypothetical protein